MAAKPVEKLLSLRNEGKLRTDDVRRVAVQLGKSERTIWRWLDESTDEVESDQFVLGETDLVEVGVYRGNAAAAWRSRRASGGEVPSLRTFQRTVARELSASTRAYVTDGDAARRRHELYLSWSPPHRNAVWHADHKELPLKVLAPRSDQLLRPWLTTFIDAFARRVMGWALSVRPTGSEVLAALGSGIERTDSNEPGGIPDLIVVDGGKEFLGRALDQVSSLLVAEVRVAPPYTPTFNGKIERWHRTLAAEVFSPLPGYEGGPRRRNGDLYGPAVTPMTLLQVQFLIRNWICSYNDEREHSAVGTTPTLAWLNDPTPICEAAPEVLSNHFVIKETRKVRREGIRFASRDFVHPDLNGLVGDTVEIGFRPYDERSIEVFHKGVWIGSARAFLELRRIVPGEIAVFAIPTTPGNFTSLERTLTGADGIQVSKRRPNRSIAAGLRPDPGTAEEIPALPEVSFLLFRAACRSSMNSQDAATVDNELVKQVAHAQDELGIDPSIYAVQRLAGSVTNCGLPAYRIRQIAIQTVAFNAGFLVAFENNATVGETNALESIAEPVRLSADPSPGAAMTMAQVARCRPAALESVMVDDVDREGATFTIQGVSYSVPTSLRSR